MPEIFYSIQNPNKINQTFPEIFHNFYEKFEDENFTGHNRIYNVFSGEDPNMPQEIRITVDQRGEDIFPISIFFHYSKKEEDWKNTLENVKTSIEDRTQFKLIGEETI